MTCNVTINNFQPEFCDFVAVIKSTAREIGNCNKTNIGCVTFLKLIDLGSKSFLKKHSLKRRLQSVDVCVPGSIFHYIP